METATHQPANEPHTILLCTVGGAHQPILEAIDSTSPSYVCFFCTDKDPVTQKPGTIGHVTGSGYVIKADYNETKPTLPNIPTQARLNNGEFETQIVPADDLDGAYLVMRNAIINLAARFSGPRFIADYTGGTKTMTAALVCAALQGRDDVELQLVTGTRSTPTIVDDGTEQAMTASVARLRLERAMAPYLGAWSRYAYYEAAEGLRSIRIVSNDRDRQGFLFVSSLSRALALWDNFNHADALKLMRHYGGQVAQCYPKMLPWLDLLAKEKGNEPALLFDLWLNAQRCAAQGRFDDAIARWYRLLEWTAQWQLQTKLKANTADFASDLLPSGVDAAPSSDKKIKLGLWQAWQVVKHHERLSGPAQEFIKNHGGKVFDLLKVRNNSILAHGFRPVSDSDWQQVYSWTQDKFLPVLRQLAAKANIKKEPEQLPTTPPEFFT